MLTPFFVFSIRQPWFSRTLNSLRVSLDVFTVCFCNLFIWRGVVCVNPLSLAVGADSSISVGAVYNRFALGAMFFYHSSPPRGESVHVAPSSSE